MALVFPHQNILEHVFDDLFFPHQQDQPCHMRVRRTQQQWPRLDIVEHDKEYNVTVDVAGVPKQELKVEVNKDGITISFDHEESKEDTEANEGKTIRKERTYRSFRRTIGLPADGAVDTENVKANVKDGVLYLTVPKSPERIPRAVPIE
ncbi:heat shock protein Hsp20 [Chloropicon primus]|uniref:Heat shock protein Hsp20 n=1 Tax=Chloropicon primus TaxID=1764295 RepID=A0A5B8MZF5_9CHLO|nr:heat shock protein Hsp20 [Chloropicon primus]UPR05238.1 heat shock protein Hsp20 [Chloropicon primus]|eukprot:QDZ26037.1 heat shock protein Hsp20 [Chloropicon primus]